MAVHEEPGTNRPREAADTTAPAAAGGGTPAEPQERTAEEMEDRWRRCMADLDNSASATPGNCSASGMVPPSQSPLQVACPRPHLDQAHIFYMCH